MNLEKVYFPNAAQVSFCQYMIEELKGFAQGCIILRGDLNVPLNPSQDTSDGTSSLPYKKLKKIKTLLSSLTLVDTWRTINPTGRDFSYFSTLHNKHTRIDYIFLSQRDLLLLQAAKIGIKSMADHAPISLTLSFPSKRTHNNTWRLNPSLLTNTQNHAKIA